MQLSAMLVMLGVVWAVLHLWLTPLVRASWEARNLGDKMGRAGSLVALEKAGTLAGIGAVTLLSVAAIVTIIGFFGSTDTVWPQAIIDWLASVHATVAAFAEGFGSVIGILGLVGAAIALWLAARNAKHRVVEVWRQRTSIEHTALLADPSQLNQARLDPDLLPVVRHLDAVVAQLIEIETSGSPDEARKAELETQLQSALVQLAIEKARITVDFPAAAGDASLDGDPKATGAWSRLMTVVSSKRFSEDLGLLSKPLSRVTTGLLFVTLLGWSSQPLANSLQLTVNNMQVSLTAEAANRALDQALSRADVAKADNADTSSIGNANVQNASRLLGRAIRRELSRAPLLAQAAHIERAASSEMEVARALIAEQRYEAQADDAAALLRKEVSRAPLDASDGPSPTARHLETRVTPIVERLRAEQPRRFAEMVAALEARYSTPMGPLDAQAKLTKEMLDQVFDAADAKPKGELGIQAQKLVKEFGKGSIEKWVEASLKSFVADTLAGGARPYVHRSIAFKASQSSQAFIASLAQQEGAGWSPTLRAAREASMAAKVAEGVASIDPTRVDIDPSTLRRQLAGYDAVFPLAEQAAGSIDDVAAVADAAVGGGGGGGGGAAERSPSTSARGRGGGVRAGAFNFASATRSFRVRGVIVGQAYSGRPLDVTDLRWTFQRPARRGDSTRVRLAVKLIEDGRARWQAIGAFDAGVLNQAIRYAADGRVVATTIMAGEGKVIGRLTYLHPALVDTPLGCRIIESDRWVDTFTASSDRPRASSSVLGQIETDRVHSWRWLETLRLAEAVASRSGEACPITALNASLKSSAATGVRFTPMFDKSLQRFMSNGIGQPGGSKRFIEAATSCAIGQAATIGACLCQRVHSAGLPERYWYAEDHTSQLRERPLRLTRDFAWIAPSRDRLGYMDFWMHTTFSLRSNGEGNESETRAFDFPPAYIAALRAEVGKRLGPYLKQQVRSPSYEDFMRPLEEFILAQRLVRAGFDGGLGRDFPTARLSQLAKETQRHVATQPTIRWEAAGKPEEFAAFLERTDPKAAERYIAYVRDTVSRRRNGQAMCATASL